MLLVPLVVPFLARGICRSLGSLLRLACPLRLESEQEPSPEAGDQSGASANPAQPLIRRKQASKLGTGLGGIVSSGQATSSSHCFTMFSVGCASYPPLPDADFPTPTAGAERKLLASSTPAVAISRPPKLKLRSQCYAGHRPRQSKRLCQSLRPPRPIRLLAQQFCTTGSWSGHAFSVVGGAGEPSSCLVIGTTRAQDAKAANKKAIAATAPTNHRRVFSTWSP